MSDDVAVEGLRPELSTLIQIVLARGEEIAR
jgi:hypothetical protein